MERAKIHEKQRNLPEAERDITSALELENRNLNALLRRALLYTATKEYEKAEVDYSNYLSVDQTNAFVYQNYGIILQHLGKESEAIVHFCKSLELEPYS